MRKVLLLVLLLLALPALANEAEVRLPFANFEGYDTQLVLVNPTAEPISIPLNGPQWPANVVEPENILRFSAFGGEGGGIKAIPASVLGAYVEITDPRGTKVRIGGIGAPRRLAAFYDLLTGSYATFLFIHAPEGAAVKTSFSDEVLYLKAGETAIVRVPDGLTAAKLEALSNAPFAGFYGSGPVDAFALMSKQPSGELFAALPY